MDLIHAYYTYFQCIHVNVIEYIILRTLKVRRRIVVNICPLIERVKTRKVSSSGQTM